MAEALMNFTITKPLGHPLLHSSSSQLCTRTPLFNTCHQIEANKKQQRMNSLKVKAIPDWATTLMAVMVEHFEGQRDLVTHKSVWHLSDNGLKKIYLFYTMFTCWGCLFFGATKDPFYDSEFYRGDGGDGTGHCFYEKQEDIEEAARAELWREEILEEIEQKVGGLQELEEAGRK